jgi:excisionase family DNA binding protein
MPSLPNAEWRTWTPRGRDRGRSAVDVSVAEDLTIHPILTVDELAELLRVDRKSVYAAIQRKEIPGVQRIGKTIRISRDAVLTWIRDGQSAARSRR